MRPEHIESMGDWQAPAICLMFSILLHAIFWLGIHRLQAKSQEIPVRVIVVYLIAAAASNQSSSAVAADTQAVPLPPGIAQAQSGPNKLENPKGAKSVTVTKPGSAPMSQRASRGKTGAPANAGQSAPTGSVGDADGLQPAESGTAKGLSFGAGSGAGGAAASGEQGAYAYSEAKYQGAGLHNPPTRYPRLALERQWEGIVRLKVQVLTDGTAGEVQILQSSGHDLLDESAQDQVKRLWHFEPAHRGGQAVTSWVVIPVEFKIYTND